MNIKVDGFVKQLNDDDPERDWYVEGPAYLSEGTLHVASDGLHRRVGFVHWDASHVYWHPDLDIPYIDVPEGLRAYECAIPGHGY